MGVISPNIFASTLNPKAPMFVPSAYRAVEDFSDQWWDLVLSSPCFRDYWLQECFCDSDNHLTFPDNSYPVLSDIDAIVDDAINNTGKEQKQSGRDLVSLGVLKWRKRRVTTTMPRFSEKTPKIVNLKVSPRTIHQPR